jgi:hypothetical protein
MLTIYCPQGETGIWQAQVTVQGKPQSVTYAPRLHTNGRYVFDVPRGFFTSVILRSNQGLAWEKENWEAMAWLGENDHVHEVNNAFPGRDRPPPLAPAATEAAMIKMRAPAGTTAYSYGGAENKIANDGLITVDEHVADVLRSHGFQPA